MAADVMASPVSDRLTVTALLLLTFATGLVDAISVLILGHIFVANMTGNIIFLGFWFVPRAGFDLTAAIVAVGLAHLVHDGTGRDKQVRVEDELERQRRVQWQFDQTIDFWDDPAEP